jgi:hypothetical protein
MLAIVVGGMCAAYAAKTVSQDSTELKSKHAVSIAGSNRNEGCDAVGDVNEIFGNVMKEWKAYYRLMSGVHCREIGAEDEREEMRAIQRQAASALSGWQRLVDRNIKVGDSVSKVDRILLPHAFAKRVVSHGAHYSVHEYIVDDVFQINVTIRDPLEIVDQPPGVSIRSPWIGP